VRAVPFAVQGKPVLLGSTAIGGTWGDYRFDQAYGEPRGLPREIFGYGMPGGATSLNLDRRTVG
jgi:hypothetical protein